MEAKKNTIVTLRLPTKKVIRLRAEAERRNISMSDVLRERIFG